MPNGPSDDERAVLALWKSGMVAQDPRFENKALLRLVAQAMIDEPFRKRLLTDTASVLAELPPGYLPEGLELEFSENTPTKLSVVLPALGGGLDDRTPAFRERLRSRTSGSALNMFLDDIDLGDWTDPIPGGGADHGDPDTRDSSNGAAVTKTA